MVRTKKSLKKLKVEKLDFSAVPTETCQLTLGITTLLKAPHLLTKDAMIAIADYFPVIVVHQGGKFVVVGNTHLAVLLKEFLPGESVQVLVVADVKTLLPQPTLRLLSALVFGFEHNDSTHFLRLFEWHSVGERERLSPSLKTRSGLEELTGISRKIKLSQEEPDLIPGLELALDIDDDVNRSGPPTQSKTANSVEMPRPEATDGEIKVTREQVRESRTSLREKSQLSLFPTAMEEVQ